MSDGEPWYLGLTDSAMALAIFSAETLYTISSRNVVAWFESLNVLATMPSDGGEDALKSTVGELYMATAYTFTMDLLRTPAPTR